MSDETAQARPSNRPRSNLFELFEADSDPDDDFEIPHVSDDSGSSSDEESVNPRSRSSPEVPDDEASVLPDQFGWLEVGLEPNRARTDPNFTVRNSYSAQNIDFEETKKPIDFFSLFFDAELMGTLLNETNKYADHFLGLERTVSWMEDHPHSRYHKWPEGGIDMSELKKYLGLLLNMGLVPKKKKMDFWSTSRPIATPFFNEIMASNAWALIDRMLHVNDITTEVERGQPGFDPWIKVRAVLDKVNGSAIKFYVPSRNISIDESMIGMKNRVVYIQFMPNKRHARFGIKKFEICDSNGYVLHTRLYAGRDFDVHHDEGQAFGVVKELLTATKLLNKGYHLYTDNFYTKPALAEFLWEKKTLLTGTVRSNSKNLPENKCSRLAVGTSKFWRKGEMLCVSFREKKSQTKPVLLLSTAHNAEVEEKVIRNKTKIKPTAIFHYNTFMGGVDLSDKQIYHHAAERSTRRYWKKIFQNLLDISILNSWIIFNLGRERKMSRDKFILSIVESLVSTAQPEPQPQPQQQPALPLQVQPPVEPTHELVLLEGRKEKDCFICNDRSKNSKSSQGRKRTRYWCSGCKVGCHPTCLPQLTHVTDQGLTRKRKRV